MRSLFIGIISGASIFSSSYLGIALAQLAPQEVAQLDEEAFTLDFVLEKLNPIPVFTIADENGAPLVAKQDDDSKVAGVFISQTDANRFVEKLKINDPEIAAKVKVIPTSLGKIYKLSESAKTKAEPLKFAYIPEEEAVSSAKTIIEEQNEDSDLSDLNSDLEFESDFEKSDLEQIADLAETIFGEKDEDRSYEGGVPLFVAKIKDEEEYLTIERDRKQLTPLFFEQYQLDLAIAKLKQKKPELDDEDVEIEVLYLEALMANLSNGEDEYPENFILIPTEESREFIRDNKK